ncbi:hypothetical protein MtrunA17_Chr8g0338381 [Medicago truncatula]|uniref:Uncharacterized protein n=1 Tax=Medicago truncatula TaxID=3880 RepID=A0A396GEG9_MEDTR|nr:hypothetical protein MtrunA17_Chr8g0338381 [Medicago truncatula]
MTLPLWYNSNNVRKLRIVKPINHGTKILSLRRPNNNHDWFWQPLKENGLYDLVYLDYVTIPSRDQHHLIYLLLSYQPSQILFFSDPHKYLVIFISVHI